LASSPNDLENPPFEYGDEEDSCIAADEPQMTITTHVMTHANFTMWCAKVRARLLILNMAICFIEAASVFCFIARLRDRFIPQRLCAPIATIVIVRSTAPATHFPDRPDRT
jgi:hypothetical protein